MTDKVKIPGSRRKIIAGICGILLGVLGVHKFILGYHKAGFIMLGVSLVGSIIFVGPLIMFLIGLIEGIVYLTMSDENFFDIHIQSNKDWF